MSSLDQDWGNSSYLVGHGNDGSMFLLNLVERVSEKLDDNLKGLCLDEVKLLVEFLDT